MLMRARRFFIERGDVLHPIEHTRRINVDTAFGQKLHITAYGKRNRRYQRTARAMTSSGKR